MYHYETIKLDSRRSKAKRLWSTSGILVPIYRKDRRGAIKQVKDASQLIVSYAYSIPLHLSWVEAIVINGFPVYTGNQNSENRPLTAPLIGGGRFRFVRTFREGELVMRTFHLYDIPTDQDDKPDIRVVFGYSKENKNGKEEA